MKVKTKLIASLMGICLVCAVFAIGVFALRNVTLGIGGSIGFTATGVNATVSGASITGTSDDASVPNLADFSIDTKMNQTQISEKMTSWSNLELSFNDMAEDVVVAFSIKNDSTDEDNFIEVDYEYTLTNASGYNDNVDVFPGADNEYIIYPNTTNDFSLAFRVLDKKMDANIAKIDLKISLKYVEIAYVDENGADEQGVEYVVGPQGYIVGLAQTHSKNITIPSVVYSEMHQMYQHISQFNGEYFGSATDLTSITFTNAMESVNLKYCPNVTTVKLGKGIKEIEQGAFTDCTSLETISLPNSVTAIGHYAFSRSTGLKSVTIPASVKFIGISAFQGCAGLTSIVIPGSEVYMASMAFQDCTALASITISDSTIIKGHNAFANTAWYNNQSDGMVYAGKVAYCYKGTMPSGTTISLEEGTLGIANAAFRDCTGLTSIIIPNGVTQIGTSAFEGCTNLTSITIPDSVRTIGAKAFLETAWYNNQSDGIVYAGKVAYGYKGTMPSNSTYALEEGTTGIAAGAFQGCTGLTSITIPNTITVIGASAFNGCTGLTEIVIPNSVTNIGSQVFKNCTNLNSIEFEDSNGWRVSEYEVANGGTLVSVSTTNFAQNATLLKSTYCAYFWKKG